MVSGASLDSAYLKVTGTGIVAAGGECQAQAGSSAGKVVSVSTLYGATGTVPGNSGVYVFVGPTTLVYTTAAQIITASAVVPLGISASTQTLRLGMCYRPFGGGTLTNFAGGAYSQVELQPGAVIPYGVAGAAAPGAGSWDVGPCALTLEPTTINRTDVVNGWVMVTQ